MENLKIRVNSEAESKEAQELFFELGYGFDGCKIKTIQHLEYTSDYYFFAYAHDMDLTHSCDYGVFINKAHKEITLPELRDLVVLKRNDVGDATHKDDAKDWNLHYRFMNGDWYYFTLYDNWQLSKNSENWHKEHLVAIEKPMKEYLDTAKNYTYVQDTAKRSEDWIEIPEGANFYSEGGFFKDKSNWWSSHHEKWVNQDDRNLKFIIGEILWTRPTQPEELPFIDDEPKSVVDTLNERQSQYGDFSSVADTTQMLFKSLKDGDSFEDMTSSQIEALHMICSKMARIVNGNPDYLDNWHDISGYATLIEKELKNEN